MTDPYQPGYGPQYGAPGTGPGMGGQPQPGPQDAYGQSNPYNQQVYGQQPGYQQPGGYPQPGYPGAMYGQPAGFDPQAPFGRDMYGMPYSDKSKLVAGLLQLFLGGFGAGRFYLGYNGIAVAQLLVTIFTCGLGGLWPLIDAIMIFIGNVPDTYGRPLQDS
ncbi:TM2 domain-containing protein [Nocardia macrotermitis]|uniref:TM2 domain-containing protein n=1 Tax=Nocardia macrotermitis TaxID=2585198 RepID=A0A7K0D629_9NOCA|nr:NINE protein [Nocardia macrotermitis]MQY21188.1 hypothetical protein [Nocardia macrotermitis]